MSENEGLKKYRGNCHCGAFVFEVELPEIKTVTECNCSICSKKAYLWVAPTNNPVIVKDEGKLVRYAFASKMIDHQFCGNCGTPVWGTAKSDAPYPDAKSTMINARALQDLDIWSLDVKPPRLDGAKLDPQYVPSTYSGPEPNPSEFEGGKAYHGSCHCGAVTFMIKSNASLEDGSYKERIVECNCSICQRGGYVWIYPTKDQLAVQGIENLGGYAFGNNVWRKRFCKTCGVHVYVDLNPLTDEEVAALPEAVQEFRADRINKRPLTLRVLDGFDIKCVNPTRFDGWTNIRPPYVNP